MQAEAVYSNEWERARDQTNTPPDEHAHAEMSVPTAIPFRRESGPSIEAGMSPKAPSDATKLVVPLPYTLTLIVAALAAAAGIWRIEAKVGQFETAMQYERELDRQREKYLDQRFAALESKIETAGLRNAALAMQQRIDEQRK